MRESLILECRNPREATRRARAKVRLYPLIFDELASPKNVTENVTTH
jgi:hypothetical protein